MKMQHPKNLLIVFTLAICLNSNVQFSDGLRILGLYPLHVKSHFVMCEELMKGLAAKGHRVDVYSHFPQKTKIKNYHDYSLVGLVPPILNNLSFEKVLQMQNTEATIRQWTKNHQEILCDLMGSPHFQKLLRDPPKDPAYDVIVTELSVVNCYIPFGRHLNIPVVGVVTTPLADYQYPGFNTPKYLSVHSSMYSPRYSTFTRSMSFFGRLYNFWNYQRALRSYQGFTLPQQKYVEKYFGPGLPSVVDLPKDVSVVLVNRDVALEGIETFAPKVISVGGLHIVDHNETLTKAVQKWLDDSVNGCVYFSFGSMIRIETLPKSLLRALYNSFENIKPVRVLIKIAKPEELPAGLPSNVLIKPWFQQIAIFKHKNLRAFISHGGMMGSQEAIYYGIPMIVVPLMGDQFFNAMQFATDKIAIYFDVTNITEHSFTHALGEVVNNPLYRKSMQRKSAQFKDRLLPPLETSIFMVEYIHRNGKDALKSPLEDLPWWQAELWDVYAFIGASIFLVLYICVKLLRMVISSCLKRLDVDSSTKKKEN